MRPHPFLLVKKILIHLFYTNAVSPTSFRQKKLLDQRQMLVLG